MTTLDRLDTWQSTGLITEAQHRTLAAMVRNQRVSVYAELSAVLYLGVISFVGGVGWTMRAYVAELGDAAILSVLSLLVIATLWYCFAKAEPYANTEVESPNLAMDYVLYLGCLLLSAEIGYLEYRFRIFDQWHHHLLIVSVVFAAFAYRFDNRFVLSLALSSLAGWLGIRVSGLEVVAADPLRATALIYGAFVAGIGTWLHRQAIKAHFLEVYLHLSANVALAALASGVGEPALGLAYLGALLALCAAAIALGIRYRRFAFVTYGTLYGYFAISVRLIDGMNDATAIFFYGIVSGTLVLIALVALARRFGRDE